MKALKLSALLLGAVLFLGLGSSTLSAEGMKCGAGKCGSSMKAPKTCNDKNCGTDKTCKCEKAGGKCECKDHAKKGKKAMKCGASKCGSTDKKAPKKAMKCGAGKCGNN